MCTVRFHLHTNLKVVVIPSGGWCTDWVETPKKISQGWGFVPHPSMAILASCCCWRSVRRGSFASGFYTLIYYLLLVIGGTFQVESPGTPQHNDTTISSVVGQTAPLSFTVAVLISSGTTVFASVVLLVGLCVDNRLLLLPWISSVTINTLICSIYSIYLIATMPFEPIYAVIFTLDFFISILNVYCLLCVISQYQEYKAGRGRAEDVAALYQPPVKYEPWGSSYPTKKLVTFQENGRPQPGRSNKLGNRCLEARTLLVKDDNHQRRSRPHFHQETAESSTISEDRGSSSLQPPVTHDSPSTDTTSSRLLSETSTALPSPRPKRVQFRTEVVSDDPSSSADTAQPPENTVTSLQPPSPSSSGPKLEARTSSEETESKFSSPTNEASPLIENHVTQKADNKQTYLLYEQ